MRGKSFICLQPFSIRPSLYLRTALQKATSLSSLPRYLDPLILVLFKYSVLRVYFDVGQIAWLISPATYQFTTFPGQPLSNENHPLFSLNRCSEKFHSSLLQLRSSWIDPARHENQRKKSQLRAIPSSPVLFFFKVVFLLAGPPSPPSANFLLPLNTKQNTQPNP